MRVLEALLRPRSVAIVGASGDPARTAGRPAAYLRKHGFDGTLYLVNPRYRAIDGVACYPAVADLPEPPDVGLVVLAADAAIDAVRGLAERGTPAAIVLAGGFAEIDADGQRRQQALVRAAGAMRLLGPNTIGMVNVADRIALSASAALELDGLPQGGVALVSQSGGMLGALLSRGAAHGLGFSTLVATGNEADLDLCDLVEYLLDDAATKVIALYVESLRRPPRFRALATEAARRGKSLVVLKAGRSEPGARSATSHTGALAGADRMYDALFLQTGAMRVDTLDELIGVAAALTSGSVVAGHRVAILTSTGGGGVLVADALGMHGFVTPPPDAQTVGRLRMAMVGAGAVADRNPIDLTLANLRSNAYRDTIAALIDSPIFDAVVVVVGSSGLGDPSLAAAPVHAAARTSRKPVLVYVNPHALNIVAQLNRSGVPAFASAEGLAAALVALRRLGQRPHAAAPASPAPTVDLAPSAGGPLDAAESLALFGRVGVPIVRQCVSTSPDEAMALARDLGPRVVVKVLSRDVGHKSDVGGVRPGVAWQDVADACAALRAEVLARQPSARVGGWLVQAQVVGATEMLLGIVRDPQLGLALMLGAGGTTTEVFDDTAVRLLPLGPNDPEDMLASLKSRALLNGFRGRPRADVAALFNTMRQVASLAEALGERLLEAEINPLFVLAEGDGVLAADGLVVLQAARGAASREPSASRGTLQSQ